MIIFLSMAGIKTERGLMEEPVCLTLWVALFRDLAFVFSPNPPVHPTTCPVLWSIITIAAWEELPSSFLDGLLYLLFSNSASVCFCIFESCVP